jgi:phosphoenolpyruvate carboxykinase (ATP)
VKTWADKAGFATTATKLVGMFKENFKRFEAHVDADVKNAAPTAQVAA